MVEDKLAQAIRQIIREETNSALRSLTARIYKLETAQLSKDVDITSNRTHFSWSVEEDRVLSREIREAIAKIAKKYKRTLATIQTRILRNIGGK